MLELTSPKELVLICVNGKFKAGPCDYSHDLGVEYHTKELNYVNNMADLATKLSNIPLTLLCNFLSPEQKDTLFLNDLEGELAFSSVTSIFLGANLRKLRTSSNSRFLAIILMVSGAIPE